VGGAADTTLSSPQQAENAAGSRQRTTTERPKRRGIFGGDARRSSGLLTAIRDDVVRLTVQVPDRIINRARARRAAVTAALGHSRLRGTGLDRSNEQERH
jgi:hypothetical protein